MCVGKWYIAPAAVAIDTTTFFSPPSAVAASSSLLFLLNQSSSFSCHAGYLSSREYGWMCTGGRCWSKNSFSVLDSPSLLSPPACDDDDDGLRKKRKNIEPFFSGGNGSQSAVGSILRHSQKQHEQKRKGRQEQLFIARESKNCWAGGADTACDLVEVPFLHEVCSLLQQQQQQQHKAKEEEE